VSYVERDLVMFLGFEPGSELGSLPPTTGPVLVTVGEFSPPVRHRAADALRRLGLAVRVLPGCGHAAHLEAPEAFVGVLLEVAAATGEIRVGDSGQDRSGAAVRPDRAAAPDSRDRARDLWG
jgi:hypothetical protein